MCNTKIITILLIILFLSLGCKKSPATVEESTSSSVNTDTRNNPNLNLMNGDIDNYFYTFEEGIEANYSYYNDNITRGINSINQPVTFNPYIDTLNFRTFPYYTVINEVASEIDTISHMLSITYAIQDSCTTLYPLDERNPDNWCNKMLVEYEGNCPEDSVEVTFDYQFSATGTGAIEDDTTYSGAVFDSLITDKTQRFETSWTDIQSLNWNKSLNRYELTLEDTAHIMTALLCAGRCDSTKLDDTLPICENDLGLIECYDATYVIDTTFIDHFDSLIYIGIIDINQHPEIFPLDTADVVLIDRTEWDRTDITYQSEDKPYQLDTTFTYVRTVLPADSPMYRVNGDCNQNSIWDQRETYFDFGKDWCPDSLETGEGNCTVVDEDIDGDLYNEKPCHCLYNWTDPQAVLDTVNTSWNANNDFDPNRDNWRDCGWDNKCPGDVGYEYPDFNGTEGNNVPDDYERIDENGQYDFDKQHNTGEYFLDRVNPDIEGVEFCDTGDDDTCDANDPFEDRNCNGQWDGQLSKNKGNGIWDDNELYTKKEECQDSLYDNEEDCVDNESTWGPVGDPTRWEAGDPLYVLSTRLETFIVDYTNPQDHQPISSQIDTNTCATLYYEDSIYCDFLKNVTIPKALSKKFHDVDRIETFYTNKIIESPDPFLSPDIIEYYYITKTTWFQDIYKTFPSGIYVDNPNYGYGDNYGYDYHLFKNGENGYDKIKMVHPAYFNFYGYNYNFHDIEFGSWRTELLEDEIYIYTYGGQLRSGEYISTNRTIETDVANYYIEEVYEVAFDSSVTVPFKKVTYNVSSSGVPTSCLQTPPVSWLIKAHIYNPDVGEDLSWVAEDYVNRCPPYDTTLTNTFKITRTKTITMIGTGLEFGLRNTFWLGSAGENNPLGIVKDQLEIRWSEPYWQEYGSDWRVLSRLLLRSIRKTDPDSELSSLWRIFQPIKRVSLDRLVDEETFNNNPYIVNPSYGMHRLRPPHEK